MREFKESVSGASKRVDEVRAELESSSSVESTASAVTHEHDTV